MRKRPYQDLIVWQEAHKLCVQVYMLTKNFPQDEKFGLISQMRRSSYGIPMNIAEGNARRSKREHVHFIDIAIGSLEELHYQCVLAQALGYIDTKQLEKIDISVQKTGFLLSKIRSSLL